MSAGSLRLAFIGWDAGKTATYLHQFAQDNHESVAAYDRHRHIVRLRDGTTVVGILSDRDVRDGSHYDQIIVADDRRKHIFYHRANLINALLCIRQKSLVPDIFAIQHYDLDAPCT